MATPAPVLRPANDAATVVVFRKRLLPYSETFIAAQGHALRRFHPVFAGFHRDRRGLHHLAESECEWIAESRWRAELGRLPMKLGAGPPRAWVERLRRRRPVLVHAHFGADGHDALPLARALGVPLVATLHGHDVIGRIRPAQSRKLARLFREARAIIAVSRFLQGQILAAGCPPEKLVQHYIGIDCTRFTPERRETAHPTLLFVGRLVKSKGAAAAIAAAAALRGEFPDLELVIVGSGPDRAALEAQAAQVLPSCRFTGPVPPAQVRDWMQRAWALCAPRITLPSGYAEALGMVFLEAQACGLPVAAWRNGGLAETFAPEHQDLLSPEGDLDGLVGCLRRLLSDGAYRARVSRQAATHVRDHFDIGRQTAILEELYQQWTTA